MRLNMKSREQVARAWADVPRPAPPAVRPLNARVVTQVGADELLHFAGRYYLVPPVPVDAGGVLLDHLMHLQQLEGASTREQVLEIREVLEDAVRLMGTLIRPHRYRARLRVVRWGALLAHRLRGNPFRRASVEEVGWLLGFFCKRRTTLRVRPAPAMQ